MAHKEIGPEGLAVRWFVITMLGTLAYVATVFIFVL